MTHRARRAVVTLYVATAALVAWQRGAADSNFTTFRIFRASFWHLRAGLNLYAPYPAQQGAGAADLFKYSPTAALLFAPFAIAPYAVAVFAWSLLGALLLYHALAQLLPPGTSWIAALLVYADLLASMQGLSSNALVAALIVLAYVALDRGQQLRAAVLVVLGTAIKLFPIVAIAFGVFQPRRRRLALVVGGIGVAALLLPLVVTSPIQLLAQYRGWATIERLDAADVHFGRSAMHLLRGWIGGTWPNWTMQLAGLVILMAPFAWRRSRWRDAQFRLQGLVSLLIFAVLFNHQAERSSFVIAGTGVAIWCVAPATHIRRRLPRFALGVLALVGLGTLPLLAVWIGVQFDLHGWPADRVATPAAPPIPVPGFSGQDASSIPFGST